MNLAHLLRQTAGTHACRQALLDPEMSLTWKHWFERIQRAAGMLADLGANPGAHYGLLMKNSFRQAEQIWAGHWGGAIPVPINWRLAAAEIADILDDSGCKILLVDSEFVPLLDHPSLESWCNRSVIVGGDSTSYEAMLDQSKPAPICEADEDSEAILLYTGGTTGRSKGVRLSHRNLYFNAMQIGIALGIRPDDVTLNVAPMFHAAGLCSNITTLLGGAHVYLRQFSPKDFLAAIERNRVRFTTVVPAMLKMVLDDPEAGNFDRSSLRVMFYGSSPMPVPWLRGAVDFFPQAEFYQAYGLTETAPILTILSNSDHRSALASGDTACLSSAGRPLIGVELRVADDEGRERPRGGAGEVLVRAPGVMLGYHNRPKETAAALQDGWFHTGDIGAIDDTGRLSILDRKRDMIITGGENVYSGEVEAILTQHPAVAEAAVVGVSDDTLGEALLAVVAVRDGMTVTGDELIAHCRTSIGGYKIPRKFAFVPQLPRSTVGKVLKNKLRETYAS